MYTVHKSFVGTMCTAALIMCAPLTHSLSARSLSEIPGFVSYLVGKTVNPPSYADAQRKQKIKQKSAQELGNELKGLWEKNNIAGLLGVSTSEHQCSKQCTAQTCDYTRFVEQHQLKQNSYEEYPCDLWNNYPSYISQLKDQLGINSLRFSVEWALVQPENEQIFDTAALEHYADMFITCLNHDITPLVCFHHYTSPCWFADKDGFELETNAALFARYCAKVYDSIMAAVVANPQAHAKLQTLQQAGRQPLWATFNSPEGVAFKGYRLMSAPPANKKKKGLSWVAQVLKNMLESHVQAYQAINTVHAQKYGALEKPLIGFLKNITQLDPARNTLLQKICSPLSQLCGTIGDDIQNECIYRFFTTGKFEIRLPGIIKPHHNAAAPYSLDWIGVNYYSNQQLFAMSQIKEEKNSPHYTDNSNYRIYPYGLYRAIVAVTENIAQPVGAIKNANKKPIRVYVTENGIATEDDAKRNRFFQAYLHELVQAIKDGYLVYGYTPWTAFNNYEWPKTDKKNKKNPTQDKRIYGFMTVSPDGKILTTKQGSQYYQNFVHEVLEH